MKRRRERSKGQKVKEKFYIWMECRIKEFLWVQVRHGKSRDNYDLSRDNYGFSRDNYDFSCDDYRFSRDNYNFSLDDCNLLRDYYDLSHDYCDFSCDDGSHPGSN